MSSFIRSVLVLSTFVLLLAPLPAHAAGTAFINGSAQYRAVTWYYTERYVNEPSLPGPEVAFNTSTGPSGLNLGTHNCDQTDGGPIYLQANGQWRTVRLYSAPQWFCMLSISTSGAGSFSGTLAWD